MDEVTDPNEGLAADNVTQAQAAQKTGFDLKRARQQRACIAALEKSGGMKLAREYAAGASKGRGVARVGRDPTVGNQSRTFQRTDIQARVRMSARRIQSHGRCEPCGAANTAAPHSRCERCKFF